MDYSIVFVVVIVVVGSGCDRRRIAVCCCCSIFKGGPRLSATPVVDVEAYPAAK